MSENYDELRKLCADAPHQYILCIDAKWFYEAVREALPYILDELAASKAEGERLKVLLKDTFDIAVLREEQRDTLHARVAKLRAQAGNARREAADWVVNKIGERIRWFRDCGNPVPQWVDNIPKELRALIDKEPT